MKPAESMELELGLKLTRVADEFSSADFLLAKNRAGPLFISTETDTMFVLTAHVKGYRKQNIKIEINEDGTRIIVRGGKLVQETVMVGWKLYKKEAERREFKKAFQIPEGVILDKINAKFDDDESILTISMPKKVKGIRGQRVEEVKEQEITREGSETLQIVPDEVPKEDVLEETEAENAEKSGLSEENAMQLPEISSVPEPEKNGLNVANPEETTEAEVQSVKPEKMKEIQEDQNERLQKASSGQDLVETDTLEEMKNFPDEGSGEATAKGPAAESQYAVDKSGMRGEELEKKEIIQSNEGKTKADQDKCQHLEQAIIQYDQKNDQHDLKENEIQEDKEDESALVNPTDNAQPQEDMPSGTHEERARSKICTPILAGSALLLSLVAFVIHFIRTKSQPGKRKD